MSSLLVLRDRKQCCQKSSSILACLSLCPHHTSSSRNAKVCQPQLLLHSTLARRLIIITGSYDITRSGRYTIVNCGNRDAARLVNLLDDLWNVLQASIGDASLVSPSPAFRTFFNSASNAPYVKQLLTNVTTGVSLYPPEQPFQQTGSPLFICATAGGQVVGQRGGIDYYFQCLLDAYDSLMAISGTPYIVVCPYLFASGVSDSPPAHNCLSVNTSINRFRALGVDFTKFKVWVLLEAILKYYIYATTGSSGNIATDANRCLRLGAKQMLENPYDFPSPLVLCSSRLEAPRHGAPVLPRMHNADLEIYIRSNYIYYVASKPPKSPNLM